MYLCMRVLVYLNLNGTKIRLQLKPDHIWITHEHSNGICIAAVPSVDSTDRFFLNIKNGSNDNGPNDNGSNDYIHVMQKLIVM